MQALRIRSPHFSDDAFLPIWMSNISRCFRLRGTWPAVTCPRFANTQRLGLNSYRLRFSALFNSYMSLTQFLFPSSRGREYKSLLTKEIPRYSNDLPIVFVRTNYLEHSFHFVKQVINVHNKRKTVMQKTIKQKRMPRHERLYR